MSKIVPIGQKAGPISIGGFKDKDGNDTVIDQITAYNTSNPNVEIRDIGGEKFAVALGVASSVQISVVCDVRVGPEVNEVTFVADETIDVPAGEAVMASINLGDVTPVE